MNTKQLRLLKLLEIIEKNPTPSQRDLASSLDVSLGLVNANIKASVENGFVSMRQISKNRFQYALTAKGAVEKIRLSRLFLMYGYQRYKEAREKIRRIFNALEKNKVQKLVFFGVGDLAKLAWLALQGTGLEIVAVIDNNKIGENFNGVTIREMTYLCNLDFDRVVVTCDGNQDAFQSAMLDGAVPESKIVQLA